MILVTSKSPFFVVVVVVFAAILSSTAGNETKVLSTASNAALHNNPYIALPGGFVKDFCCGAT
jgi:hypothetical protein